MPGLLSRSHHFDLTARVRLSIATPSRCALRPWRAGSGVARPLTLNPNPQDQIPEGGVLCLRSDLQRPWLRTGVAQEFAGELGAYLQQAVTACKGTPALLSIVRTHLRSNHQSCIRA